MPLYLSPDGKYFEIVLAVISSQNKGLSTSLSGECYKARRRKREHFSASASAEAIGKTGYTIHYQLRRIAVQR